MEKNLVYAGFWKRFAAYWIDLLIVIPWFGICFYLNSISRIEQSLHSRSRSRIGYLAPYLLGC